MKLNSPIDLVLCDIDGVLVDAEDSIISAYIEAVYRCFGVEDDAEMRDTETYAVMRSAVWNRPWSEVCMQYFLRGMSSRSSIVLGAPTQTEYEEAASTVHRLKNELLVRQQTPSINPLMVSALSMYAACGVKVVLYTGGSAAATLWKLGNVPEHLRSSISLQCHKEVSDYESLVSRHSKSPPRSLHHAQRTLVIDDDALALMQASGAGCQVCCIQFKNVPLVRIV